MKKVLLFICLFVLASELMSQVDFDDLNASESFREGVVAFHRGRINESIISFQRSLSLRPTDIQTKTWLGRSYFFAGFVNAALTEWREIESISPPFLKAFADSIEAQQSLALELEEDFEFFLIENFEASEYTNAFLHSSGIYTDGRGNIFINFFGNNRIGRINQNGEIEQSLLGGINALSGPFDLDQYGENLYVTNFLGDYISVLNSSGNTVRRIGTLGIGDGELIGPQYISISQEPAIYVSDHGNQRIVKFDLDGNYLFHFADPSSERGREPSLFDGLSKVGGIISSNNGLFVINNVINEDSEYADLLFFDFFGNLIEIYPRIVSEQVEDLWTTAEQEILMTGRSTVYLFNPENLALETLYEGEEGSQFVSARIDDNNNLIVSDFRNSRLLVLSRLAGIYSGYQVAIHSVDSSNFPNIQVNFSVRDTLGNDIIDLSLANFQLSEEGLPLTGQRLVYSGSEEDESSIAVIVEASEYRNSELFKIQQEEATLGIISSLPENLDFEIYSAGLSPILEFTSESGGGSIRPVLKSIPSDPEWKIDQAIRLAGNSLIRKQKKREILFVGRGFLPDWAYSSIGLSETLAYLRNNGIRFNLVELGQQGLDQSLIYLVEETGGTIYRNIQQGGLQNLKDNFASRRTGFYTISARSQFDASFGREYIPLEIEVIHFAKSGRDESGYFAPLQY